MMRSSRSFLFIFGVLIFSSMSSMVLASSDPDDDDLAAVLDGSMVGGSADVADAFLSFQTFSRSSISNVELSDFDLGEDENDFDEVAFTKDYQPDPIQTFDPFRSY
jgi:hypothetical protein